MLHRRLVASTRSAPKNKGGGGIFIYKYIKQYRHAHATVWGVFAARVQFVLCGLATIYLTHYMASTTIYGGFHRRWLCIFGALIPGALEG